MKWMVHLEHVFLWARACGFLFEPLATPLDDADVSINVKQLVSLITHYAVHMRRSARVIETANHLRCSEAVRIN